MFDEEADTVSFDPGVLGILRTGTIEVVIDADFGRDTSPVEAIEFEDTLMFITPIGTGIDLHPTIDEAPPTDKMRFRPGTDGEWPPAPRPPTVRKHRRAGMYKAITVV